MIWAFPRIQQSIKLQSGMLSKHYKDTGTLLHNFLTCRVQAFLEMFPFTFK